MRIKRKTAKGASRKRRGFLLRYKRRCVGGSKVGVVGDGAMKRSVGEEEKKRRVSCDHKRQRQNRRGRWGEKSR
jgi:hypothetical protein